MDMTHAMRVAAEVARVGSFGGAARELRLSAASVSRIVADLEADLGVRLFNRTTRQLNLTDAGQDFVRESAAILEQLENMRSRVRERHDVPRGELRVSCVAAFGSECLAPALPGFLTRFPQLSVSVDVGNRIVDLIEEHYDVAIRVGRDCQESCARGHSDGKENHLWQSTRTFWTSCWLGVTRRSCFRETAFSMN